MRSLNQILKAFSGVAILSVTLCTGCEDVQPQKPVTVTVSPVIIPTPTPPVAMVTPTPAKPEPVITPMVEELPPEKFDKMIDGARQALRDHKLDKALSLAELATKKSPSRSAGWNTLGRAQMQMGKRKAAVASFEKAVELNPASVWALNNLGLALIYDGRYEDAVDALEEATGMDDAEAYMFNNLGMAYEHLDRLDDARQAYSEAKGLKNAFAVENLVRLRGVKSVMKTAHAEITPTSDSIESINPSDVPDGGAE